MGLSVEKDGDRFIVKMTRSRPLAEGLPKCRGTSGGRFSADVFAEPFHECVQLVGAEVVGNAVGDEHSDPRRLRKRQAGLGPVGDAMVDAEREGFVNEIGRWAAGEALDRLVA